MGCCGGREKEWEVKPAQKWDYINLNDFSSTSCFTPLSYGILWIMLGVSIACYVADFSTMINLLLWNRFGTITPPAPFGIESLPKWVFTGCIILSYVLLAYRWWRAYRAMKSGGVAKCYLDPLAARITSIKPGNRGRGYRRFLVFAELTKSKHGTEYIALFVHFAFEAWLRIIFAEAPRNAINAFTIYHLVTSWADVSNSPDKNVNDSGIQKFWAAVSAQANENHIQAAVFVGMVFTIVIWVFAFIGLAVAFVLYILFLWHHIPQQDGGLRGYCKRKVDKSVEKIVSAKIKQALEDEQKGAKRTAKAAKAGLQDPPADLKRQPTLPVLMDEEAADLPPYASRPGTPISALDKKPTLPDMGSNFSRPRPPSRTVTGTSNTSFASDAPLLSEAAEIGHAEPGRAYSPAPGSVGGRPYSPVNGRSASPAPPPRPFTPTGELVMNRAASPGPNGPQRPFTPTGGPQKSFGPAGPMPPFAPGARPPGPPNRSNTPMSDRSGGRASPAPGQPRQLTPANGSVAGPRPPMGPMPPMGMNRTGSAMSAPANGRGPPLQAPPRSNMAGPYNMQGRQSPASFSPPGPGPYAQRPPGRQTPVQEYEMQPQSRSGPGPAPGSGPGFQAYRPGTAQSQSPATPAGAGRPLLGAPQPSFNSHESTYGDSILDDYVDSDSADRKNTRKQW